MGHPGANYLWRGVGCGLALLQLVLLGLWWALLPRADAGKALLRYGTFGTAEQLLQEKELVARFEELHPDIDVKLEFVTSGNYLFKLKMQIAGRTAPDVTWMGTEDFQDFVSKGAFRPLDDLIARDPTFNLDDYFPVMINAYMYQGKHYGIPKDNSPLLFFYNKEAFDAVHVPYPTADWTWKELVDAGKELTRDLNGDHRVDQYMFIPMWEFTYFFQCGCPIIDPDTGLSAMDTPEARTAMQFIHDFVYVEHLGPTGLQIAGIIAAGGASDTGLGVVDLFPMGKVACFACNPAVVPYFTRVCTFDFDCTELPAGETDAQIVDGAAYPILAQSRYPYEAWELVKFLTGPEVQTYRARAGDSVPSLKSVAASDAFLKRTAPPQNMAEVSLDIVQKARRTPSPRHPKWAELRATWNQCYERVMTDDDPMPVEEALRVCAERMNKILANPY